MWQLGWSNVAVDLVPDAPQKAAGVSLSPAAGATASAAAAAPPPSGWRNCAFMRDDVPCPSQVP